MQDFRAAKKPIFYRSNKSKTKFFDVKRYVTKHQLPTPLFSFYLQVKEAGIDSLPDSRSSTKFSPTPTQNKKAAFAKHVILLLSTMGDDWRTSASQRTDQAFIRLDVAKLLTYIVTFIDACSRPKRPASQTM